MMSQRLLLVGTDAALALPTPSCPVRAVPTLAAAQQCLDDEPADVVLAAATLPDGTGLDLVPHLETIPGRPLLVLLGGNQAETSGHPAVFECLTESPSAAVLHDLLRRTEAFRRARQAASRTGAGPGEDLLGQSPATQELRAQLRRAARTDTTVLIQGEPHTGKKLVARLIHRLSPRAGEPFLALDCAALPEAPAREELFGTTAKGPGPGTPGRLALAHGGTLLLEEVGALSLEAQDCLLGVLESRTLPGQAADLDVRLIATSSRPLHDLVRQGAFREALYHALNLVPLRTTPLRERPDDLAALAEHFRGIAARRHGKPVLALAPGVAAALRQHAWPGNLRELESTIDRAVQQCPEGVLEPSHLSSASPAGLTAPASPAATAEAELLETAEKRHILALLLRCQGNRTHAARRLGISLRTLRNKLRQYRMETGENTAEIPPPRLGADACLLGQAVTREP